MKKLAVFFFALTITCAVFSSPLPRYEAEGLSFDVSFNYGKTFNNELDIYSLGLFEHFIPSGNFTENFVIFTIFSPDVNIFDFYYGMGFTYYPFDRIISFSAYFGIGLSIYALLNHFPYFVNANVNIDIPIYRGHHITFIAGVQHRNAFKLIGYIKSDTYYGIYNSYFAGIGYRYIISKKNSPP